MVRILLPEELQFFCLREYHVYQDGWLPVWDEKLACQCETDNAHDDPFAVNIVEHLPVQHAFYFWGVDWGVITCKITDSKKQYSRDLEGKT